MNSRTDGAPRWQRKKILVDKSLQGALIVAFVILEAAILSAAIAYLYWRFGRLLDDLTFRTHFAGLPDIGGIFREEGFKVIAACTVVNGAALLIADRLWIRHIDRALTPFRQTIARVTALDFRAADELAEEGIAANHEVVALAQAWLAGERQPLENIDEKLAQLEATPVSDRKSFAAALSALSCVLDETADSK
jgi:hypothetical protein